MRQINFAHFAKVNFQFNFAQVCYLPSTSQNLSLCCYFFINNGKNVQVAPRRTIQFMCKVPPLLAPVKPIVRVFAWPTFPAPFTHGIPQPRFVSKFNLNCLWWVHMGILLKERKITEELMLLKIWKIANPQAFTIE